MAEKRRLIFSMTNPDCKVTGAVMLEQERVIGGEQRQKHLALEYFACFAVDEHDQKLPRADVEDIFRGMSELEIRLGLHRLNAALQEKNIMTAQSLGVPVQMPPSAQPKPKGKRIKPPPAKD